VLLWFAGLGWVLAWVAFQDPAIDYRLVMLGTVLPDVVDALFGGPRVLHTLLFSAVLLGTVMLFTRGRRAARRRLLALPIGTFLHLILDGVWARTHLFWWPVFGVSFGPGGLPSLSRPLGLLAVQELAGAAALWWCWIRFHLSLPARRQAFLRTGRLAPDLGRPGRQARRS
jgi:membrane-bound metal-dependent hydrolase YbcI (DUF457 family)